MRLIDPERLRRLRALWGRDMAIVAVIAAAFLVLEPAFGLYRHLNDAIEATARFHSQAIFLSVVNASVVFLVMRSLALRHAGKRQAVAEGRASTLMYRDAMTGLGNRKQFNCELEQLGPGPQRAVLMLDLDDFRPLNDALGHAAGDEVVREAARRISTACPASALVCRFDGDEFAVLTGPLAEAADADWLAHQIIAAFEQPFTVGGTETVVRVSIGIALIEAGANADGETVRRAALTLDASKSHERGGYRRYDPAMDEALRRRTLMERKLRKAIQLGSIRPYFQPLVDLQTSELIGFEALARWTDPELGSVPPDEFIRLAEKAGLINALSDQLLRHACRAAISWPDHIKLSFNLSPLQLKDRLAGLRIISVLGETGLSPHRLEIEVTESSLIDNPAMARDLLEGLRGAGVRTAIDDFGSGYSSLYHLREFKFDNLKIDRSFVWAMNDGQENLAIVNAILDLSRGLGLITTAEGIESEEQLNSLLSRGCQQGQGYLFGRAMSAEHVLTMIEQYALPELAAQ